MSFKHVSRVVLITLLVTLMTGMLSACGADAGDPQETLESTDQALSAQGFGFA